MTPLRAAVLVFLIGASTANAFAAKEYIDRLGPGPGPAPTATPTPENNPLLSSPTAAPTIDANNPLADLTQTANPIAVYDARVQNYRTKSAPIYDVAWMREAVIVTVAGVAWFLVRARERAA